MLITSLPKLNEFVKSFSGLSLRILKRLWQTFNIIALASFSLCLILIVFSYFYAQQKLSKKDHGISLVKTQLADAQSPELRSAILNGTVDLSTYSMSARGYIPPNTHLLLTNHHVVEAACRQPNCATIILEIGSSNKEDETSSQRSMYDILECSEWLDACILSEVNNKDIENELRLLTMNKSKADITRNLFILPLKDDEPLLTLPGENAAFSSKLITGKAEIVRHSNTVANIAIRKGYSGSPVFDENGRIMGIVSRGSPFQNPNAIDALFEAIQSGKGDFFENTVIVNYEAILDLILARTAKVKLNVLRHELEAFLETFSAELQANSQMSSVFRIITCLGYQESFFDSFKFDLLNADADADINDLKKIFHSSRSTTTQSSKVEWRDHKADRIWLKAFATQMFFGQIIVSYLNGNIDRLQNELLEIGNELDFKSKDGLYIARLLDLTNLVELETFSKPSTAAHFLERSRAFNKLNLQKLALEDANSAISMDPSNEGALLIRGELRYHHSGDYKGAIEDLTQVLSSAKGDNAIEAYHLRGRAFYSTQRYQDCLADLALAEGELYVDFHKGSCFMGLGQNEDALASFTKQLEIFNNTDFVLVARAEALSALGRNQEALVDLKKAREYSGPNERIAIDKKIVKLSTYAAKIE